MGQEMGPCLRRGTCFSLNLVSSSSAREWEGSIGNSDNLRSGIVATDDFQRCFGQAERLGKQFQNRCIGLAIFGGCGDTDQQREVRAAFPRQADAVFARIGSDLDGEFAVFGRGEERLMPEMAHAGEQHGETRFIRSGNDFVVADRAAGLDYRGCSRFDSGHQAIGKGKKGV